MTVTSRQFSGNADTLVIGDANNVGESTGAPVAIETVPTNASVNLPYGTTNNTEIELFALGAGGLSIVGAGSARLVQEGDSSSNGGSTVLVNSGTSFKPFASNVTSGNTIVAFFRPPGGGTNGTPSVTGITSAFSGTWHFLQNYFDSNGRCLEIWYCVATSGGQTITPTIVGSGQYLAYACEWANITSVSAGACGTGTATSGGAAGTPAGLGSAIMSAINTAATVTSFPVAPWTGWNTGAWSFSNYGLGAARTVIGTEAGPTWGWGASADFVSAAVVLNASPSVTLRSIGNLSYLPQLTSASIRQRAQNDWVLLGQMSV